MKNLPKKIKSTAPSETIIQKKNKRARTVGFSTSFVVSIAYSIANLKAKYATVVIIIAARIPVKKSSWWNQ